MYESHNAERAEDTQEITWLQNALLRSQEECAAAVKELDILALNHPSLHRRFDQDEHCERSVGAVVAATPVAPLSGDHNVGFRTSARPAEGEQPSLEAPKAAPTAVAIATPLVPHANSLVVPATSASATAPPLLPVSPARYGRTKESPTLTVGETGAKSLTTATSPAAQHASSISPQPRHASPLATLAASHGGNANEFCGTTAQLFSWPHVESFDVSEVCTVDTVMDDLIRAPAAWLSRLTRRPSDAGEAPLQDRAALTAGLSAQLAQLAASSFASASTGSSACDGAISVVRDTVPGAGGAASATEVSSTFGGVGGASCGTSATVGHDAGENGPRQQVDAAAALADAPTVGAVASPIAAQAVAVVPEERVTDPPSPATKNHTLGNVSAPPEVFGEGSVRLRRRDPATV